MGNDGKPQSRNKQASARNGKGQFVKGQSGNPGGRPKTDFLKRMVGRINASDWDTIVDVAVQQAKDGDAGARTFIASYMMGKPVERVHEEQDWTPERLVELMDSPNGKEHG